MNYQAIGIIMLTIFFGSVFLMLARAMGFWEVVLAFLVAIFAGGWIVIAIVLLTKK